MSHVDQSRIEEVVRETLPAAGEDPDRDGLSETSGRVACTYRGLFSGLAQDPAELLLTTFDINHEEFVLVRDIELTSCCEYHLLPFFGVTHVGYISGGGRVTGLSKLAQLVDIYTRRLQVQKRLTMQVADALAIHLGVQGVIVVTGAERTCMTMRGVRRPGSRTVTGAARGQLHNAVTRAKAMSLIMAR